MADYKTKMVFEFGSKAPTGYDLAELVRKHDLYYWKCDIYRGQLIDSVYYTVTFEKDEDG